MAKKTPTWTKIPGFPGFEIMENGRVRSSWSTCTLNAKRLKKPRELPSHRAQGYTMFTFRDRDGFPRPVGLHRLLLAAFVRAPKKGEVGRHLNGKKDDNDLSNLAWGSNKDNVVLDEIRLGKRVPLERLRSIPEGVARAVRARKAKLARDLSKEYGISVSSVYRFWRE